MINVPWIGLFVSILLASLFNLTHRNSEAINRMVNMIFKIMWLVLSLIELYLIYNIVPNKKINIISNIGANTLNIYLLHSLVIKWLKVYGMNIFCYTEIINVIIIMVLTCVLLVLFGREFIKDKIVTNNIVDEIYLNFILKKICLLLAFSNKVTSTISLGILPKADINKIILYPRFFHKNNTTTAT